MKMLLHWRANLADHVPSMTSQYETNLWSTHVNIVLLAKPIRHCVRWWMQVFKIEGFVCKHFLPSPPPSPVSIFWLLLISRVAKAENPVPQVFLCSERIQRLLHRLHRRLGVDFSFRWSMLDSWLRYFFSLPELSLDYRSILQKIWEEMLKKR